MAIRTVYHMVEFSSWLILAYLVSGEVFWLFQRQQLRRQDPWAGEGVKGSSRVQSALSRESLGSAGRAEASNLMAVCACDFQRNTWSLT